MAPLTFEDEASRGKPMAPGLASVLTLHSSSRFLGQQLEVLEVLA